MRRMARVETRKTGRLSSPAKALDTPQTAPLLDRRNLHVQAREECGLAFSIASPTGTLLRENSFLQFDQPVQHCVGLLVYDSTGRRPVVPGD